MLLVRSNNLPAVIMHNDLLLAQPFVFLRLPDSIAILVEKSTSRPLCVEEWKAVYETGKVLNIYSKFQWVVCW